jgi:spermidine synthase
LAAIALLPPWDPMHYAIGRFRSRSPTPASYAGAEAFTLEQNRNVNLLFHDDDPVSSVVILESGKSSRARSILNNGKPDGNTASDYPTMCLAGLIPALLTDDPSRAFVIGWGTGVTAGELGALSTTKEVNVAEISPAVIDGAHLFRALNRQADVNPKVHALRRDAYRALLRSEGRYGIIVSEPSNPWVTGIEMLFSQEFLTAARAKLTPGGVYAQWFHLYEVDKETVEIVAATYASVFDQVAVWFTIGPDVLLIGLNSPTGYPDLETIRARAERPDLHAGLVRCGARSLPELLSHEFLPPGLLRKGNVSGAIHTLRRPILSQHAARAFFSGGGLSLPRFAGGPDAAAGRPRTLLAELLGEGPVPEEIAASVTKHLCESLRTFECVTWLARWRADHPESRAARLYDPRSIERMGQQEALSPMAIARVEQLFRGSVPADPQQSNPLIRATRITQLFSVSYVHTIPFDRAILRDAWNECGNSGELGSACHTARLSANERLDHF